MTHVCNPIERAWSLALMDLARAEKEIRETSDQWFIDHFHSAGSLNRGDYARCIATWWPVFPGRHTLIMRFDETEHDPKSVLKRCAVHLGGNDREIDFVDSPI